MKLNSMEQPPGSITEVDEPHFDDEVTLLSARPVVPLERIDIREYFNKGLVLGLSLAGAVLIVVFATILVYRFGIVGLQRVENQSPSVSQQQSSTIGDGSTESAGATGVSSMESDQSAKDGMGDGAQEALPAESNSSLASAPPNRLKTHFRPSANTISANSDPETQSRTVTRARRKGVRQPGNDYQGERRNGRARPSDDVLRIREIFEGPVKP